MGCAGVLTDALAEAGVKNLSKLPPNKGRGHVIVSGEIEGGQLGKLADAVNKAETPHREQVKPAVSLELFAKLDKESAAAALKALATIGGVDAGNSKSHLGRGVLAVRLAGGKPLTVATIIGALKTAGVDAKVITGAAPPKPTEIKDASVDD